MISGKLVADIAGGALVGWVIAGALIDFRIVDVIIMPFESNTVS